MRELLASLAIGVSMILFGLLLLLIFSPPVLAARSCPKGTVEASWYGKESCVNKRDCRTASGERYTGNDMTAAMPDPIHYQRGERWRVTYMGKSVVVRITDYGPAKHLKRGIDLSKAAAKKIGIYLPGTGCVHLERVK